MAVGHIKVCLGSGLNDLRQTYIRSRNNSPGGRFSLGSG